MNATRHGTTNFKMLRPYLNGMGPDGDSHRRFTAEGFMDLVAEYLFYSDYKGRPVYSLTHYGRQNGDAMRDPDMTVSVDWSAGSVEPLTFQNDYLGVYQEVYKSDEITQAEEKGNFSISALIYKGRRIYFWQGDTGERSNILATSELLDKNSSFYREYVRMWEPKSVIKENADDIYNAATGGKRR